MHKRPRRHELQRRYPTVAHDAAKYRLGRTLALAWSAKSHTSHSLAREAGRVDGRARCFGKPSECALQPARLTMCTHAHSATAVEAAANYATAVEGMASAASAAMAVATTGLMAVAALTTLAAMQRQRCETIRQRGQQLCSERALVGRARAQLLRPKLNKLASVLSHKGQTAGVEAQRVGTHDAVLTVVRPYDLHVIHDGKSERRSSAASNFHTVNFP
eukprot:6195901-Pleurochrysis_carterae.AAC.2